MQAENNSSNTFKKGYQHGYNQAIIDMQQPHTPQPQPDTDPLPVRRLAPPETVDS